jgi:uncharacterized protein
MKRREEFDPRRLDVDAFVDSTGLLGGQCAVGSLSRLASLVLPDAEASVAWDAIGERRQGPDRRAQRWVRLRVQSPVRMTCQRCLEPVALDLRVDRALRFVPTEAEAEALDLDSDDDVLAASHRLDLIGLVEDELVLALPTVPRHESCLPPRLADPEASAPPTRPNPFAVLRKAPPDTEAS